jgi:hypothetical protein
MKKAILLARLNIRLRMNGLDIVFGPEPKADFGRPKNGHG